VGAENFFLFGLQSHEVAEARRHYDPAQIIAADRSLAAVMAMLEAGAFNVDEPGLFAPIIDSIRNPQDQWLTAADFGGFVDAQRRAGVLFQDQEQWQRVSVLNTASSGHFSSDRTIRSYAKEIWHLPPPAGA
jgi:starch phosphorylase